MAREGNEKPPLSSDGQKTIVVNCHAHCPITLVTRDPIAAQSQRIPSPLFFQSRRRYARGREIGRGLSELRGEQYREESDNKKKEKDDSSGVTAVRRKN